MTNSSDILSDGVPVKSYLREIVRKYRTGAQNSDDMFWSSQPLHHMSPARDVFQVEFSGPRPINHLQFFAAHFPQDITAEYWHPGTERWTPLREQIGKITDIDPAFDIASQRAKWEGDPVGMRIMDSNPPQITAVDDPTTIGTTHPQHFGARHWMKIKWKVVPVHTKAIRLVMVRHGQGTPPVGPNGFPIAYSLGIKDFQPGFRIYSKDDIPASGRITMEDFATSTDLLGSRVSYRLKEHSASNVLNPIAGLHWKSEPQPVNYAVVNFYADVRDSHGSPQTIDRFYIDPLTVGPSMNIYYTNDESDSNFTADDSALTYPIASIHGDALEHTASPLENTTREIIYSEDAAAYTDIDNSYLQWDPERPWWLGMSVRMLTEEGHHPWFSFAGNTLRQNGRDVEFITQDGIVTKVAIPEIVRRDGVLNAMVIYTPGGHAPYPGVLRQKSEDVTRNGFRNPAPASDWGFTFTRATAQFLNADDGVPFMRVTANQSVGPLQSRAETTHLLRTPITPGEEFEFRCESRAVDSATSAPVSRRLQALFHDAAGNYLSFVQGPPTDSSVDWTHTVVSGIAPPGAASVGLYFGSSSPMESGDQMDFRRITSATGGYFDGDTEDDYEYTYEWEGAPHASASLRTKMVNSIVRPEEPSFSDTNPFFDNITLLLSVPGGDTPRVQTLAVLSTSLGERPEKISVGRYSTENTPGIPAFALRGLVLKIDEVPSPGHAEGFLHDPDLWVLKPDFEQAPDLTTNALLRMHPTFATPNNISGAVGGPGDRYDDAVWIPVSRDYALRQGFVRIPPTRARHFKFEFTNLVHETYESLVPIRREVRLFPSEVVAAYNRTRRVPLTADYEPQDTTGEQRPDLFSYQHQSPGTQTMMDISDASRYESAIGLLRQRTLSEITGAKSATEAYVAGTPEVQKDLSDLGWVWSWTPWHIGASAPKFVLTQRHGYEKVTVEHRSKTAFFVGIRRLDAYRVDYATDDDTDIYYEHFLDDANIAEMESMEFTDSGIQVVGNFGRVTSNSFPSKRQVRGLQFASVQSDSLAMLFDDGFVDEDLTAHWSIYGDANLTRRPLEGVLVNRGWYARTYGNIETEFGAYGHMEGKAYHELEGAQPNGMIGGGIESEKVTPNQSGNIYAAARVTAVSSMSGPIRLEIISVDTGRILGVDERYLTQGESVILGAGYNVGSALDTLTYGDLEGSIYRTIDGTPYRDLEVESVQGDVFVRLYQSNPSQDAFLVERLSLFDSPVVWQFSVDDGLNYYDALNVRNNPEGVLTFPESGDRLRWRALIFHPDAEISALCIRPWYGGLLGSLGRKATDFTGPNRSALDDYPEIGDDPMWAQSHSPIPEWWHTRDVASPHGRPPTHPGDGESIYNPDERYGARPRMWIVERTNFAHDPDALNPPMWESHTTTSDPVQVSGWGEHSSAMRVTRTAAGVTRFSTAVKFEPSTQYTAMLHVSASHAQPNTLIRLRPAGITVAGEVTLATVNIPAGQSVIVVTGTTTATATSTPRLAVMQNAGAGESPVGATLDITGVLLEKGNPLNLTGPVVAPSTTVVNAGPSPSVEILNGWSSSVAAVYAPSLDTTKFRSGLQSRRYERTAEAPGPLVMSGLSMGGIAQRPAGATHVTAGAYYMVDSATIPNPVMVRTRLIFRNEGTTVLDYVTPYRPVTQRDVWDRTVVEPMEIPAGVTNVLLGVQIVDATMTSPAPVGGLTWVDDAMIVFGDSSLTLPEYFDGDTEPTDTHWFRWAGTPHNSPSIRTVRSPAFFSGNSQDTHTHTHDWHDTENESPSDYVRIRRDPILVATNLHTNPRMFRRTEEEVLLAVNLATNPSVEGVSAGWSSINGELRPSVRDGLVAYSGNYSHKVTLSAADTTAMESRIGSNSSDGLVVTPDMHGQEFTGSARLMAPYSGTLAHGRMAIFTRVDGVWTQHAAGVATPMGGGFWTLVHTTFTMPAGADRVRLTAMIQAAPGQPPFQAGAESWADNAALVRGNQPLNFTPHPRALTNFDQQNMLEDPHGADEALRDLRLGWSTRGTWERVVTDGIGTWQVTTTEGEGGGSLVLAGAGSGGASNYSRQSDVMPGRTYRARWQARVLSGTGILSTRAAIRHFEQDDATSGTFVAMEPTSFTNLTDEWQWIERTFTIPEDRVRAGVSLTLPSNVAIGAVIQFRNISFTQALEGTLEADSAADGTIVRWSGTPDDSPSEWLSYRTANTTIAADAEGVREYNALSAGFGRVSVWDVEGTSARVSVTQPSDIPIKVPVYYVHEVRASKDVQVSYRQFGSGVVSDYDSSLDIPANTWTTIQGQMATDGLEGRDTTDFDVHSSTPGFKLEVRRTYVGESVSDWFDGATPDTATNFHQWLGTPHHSHSTKTAP